MAQEARPLAQKLEDSVLRSGRLHALLLRKQNGLLAFDGCDTAFSPFVDMSIVSLFYVLRHHLLQSLKRALGKLFLQGGSIEVKGNSILVKTKFGTKKYLYIAAATNEELQEWTEALQASIEYVCCHWSKPSFDVSLPSLLQF